MPAAAGEGHLVQSGVTYTFAVPPLAHWRSVPAKMHTWLAPPELSIPVPFSAFYNDFNEG